MLDQVQKEVADAADKAWTSILLAILNNEQSSRFDLYVAADKIKRIQDNIMTYPYEMVLLRWPVAGMLFLPAEMCIEYQLFSKAQFQGDLAVAAYGDCYLKYIATDKAFDQGGYEVDPKVREVGQGIEHVIKSELLKLFADITRRPV